MLDFVSASNEFIMEVTTKNALTHFIYYCDEITRFLTFDRLTSILTLNLHKIEIFSTLNIVLDCKVNFNLCF